MHWSLIGSIDSVGYPDVVMDAVRRRGCRTNGRGEPLQAQEWRWHLAFQINIHSRHPVMAGVNYRELSSMLRVVTAS